MQKNYLKIKNNNNESKNERKTIMKTTRRIIVLALAAILVLGLVIPAFAAANDGKGGTIKVEGTVLQDPSKYTVYTVYKMFDVEPAVGTSGNKYKITAAWAGFADVAGVSAYLKVVDGYVMWQKETTSAADAAAVAELAKAYAAGNTSTIHSVGTVTVNGEALEVEDDGYYLLVPSNNTACGVQVVIGDANVTVVEKTQAPGLPVVEKQVKEDSTGTYGSANTAEIGQVIEYQTTITAGAGASKYILHDEMDEHIAFTNDITVTRDGNNVAATNNYQIKLNPGDGCTFHVEFTDTMCASLADDAVVVVRYTGKLLEGADTATDHTNKTWLTYTEQNVKSNDSIVATQTYKIEATKYGKKGEEQAPLADAGFVLRDNVNKYYKWDATNQQVTWVTNIEDADIVYSGADGKFAFRGVDAENFTLVEHIVPGGYTGVKETPVNTKSGDVRFGAVNIINTLGTALPETGGIGTTVFYILGAALVIVALGALVIVKRKETSAQ